MKSEFPVGQERSLMKMAPEFEESPSRPYTQQYFRAVNSESYDDSTDAGEPRYEFRNSE